MYASRVTALAGCLLSLTALQSLADEEMRVYIGGSFGTARVDIGSKARDLERDLVGAGFGSASVSIDDKASAFRLLGGFQVNQNFAVEGYYASLGKYDLSLATTGPTANGSGDVKLSGLGVDVLGILPFTSRLSGIGRVGFFSWDAKSSFTANAGGTTSGDSVTEVGTDFKIGVGIEWKAGARVRLRAEVERYNFDDPLTFLSLGLVFRLE